MNRKLIRALLLLERPEAWVNFASIWDAMRQDPIFSPVVWLLPYSTNDLSLQEEKVESMRQLLSAQGIEYHEWAQEDVLHEWHFDVAIINHPYDRGRPVSLSFDRIAATVPITVYVPYGLAVGGGYKNTHLQYAQPTQIRADLVVARSEMERKMYATHCPSGDSHVHVLGHPRFDILKMKLADPIPRQTLQFINNRVTILWNSHFAFGKQFSQSGNFSTFDLIGPELLDLAICQRDRLCLIWRPHPQLMPEIERQGLLNASDFEPLRAELRSVGILLDESPTHWLAFRVSDALISDAGSFLLEYLATGKPILSLVNPEGEPLNTVGAALRSELCTASTPTEVLEFIDAFDEGRVQTKEDIQRIQRVHLPLLDGHSGARVVAQIRDIAVERKMILADSKAFPGSVPLRTPNASDATGAARRVVVRVPTDSDPLTPTLDRLLAGLRALREEKAREPCWKKRARRATNLFRGSLSEIAKQWPGFMQTTRQAMDLIDKWRR